MLQIFAASELALLQRESVCLKIEGSADQPGKKLENELLSRNRAISVFVYLKNMLEGDLPLEELEPIWSNEKEEIEDIRTKRELKPDTPIFIPGNDRVTIIAHGEPDSSEGGEKEYDVEHRRAQLTVDNALVLSLRRMKDI